MICMHELINKSAFKYVHWNFRIYRPAIICLHDLPALICLHCSACIDLPALPQTACMFFFTCK